ncbi:hypothetical protein NQ317_016879 [Molorchus minor]|uniref:TNFR-Cys domain-containing protein n=1 Tax=Molorchus minor TaxID=1323400 RepID=A0ABQ9J8S8_9CUCU|nr:hypothetical protein NQ317_016879 [Molorchus minor]
MELVEVMVSTYTSLLVLSSLASLTSSSICPEKQYLHSKMQVCLNCTDCKNGTVVLRPCEFHRDTLCGPISELLKTIETGNPHRHRHNNYHRKHRGEHNDMWKSEEDGEVASSEVPFSSAETLVWDWQAVALTSAVFACILFFSSDNSLLLAPSQAMEEAKKKISKLNYLEYEKTSRL